MKISLRLLSIMLCMILSMVGRAQYFNKEIDFNHTSDFASGVLLIDSGQIFVFGGGLRFDTPAYQLQWLLYSLQGDTIIKSEKLFYPGWASGVSYGNLLQLPDGNVVSAFYQFFSPGTPQERCFAGLLKINPLSLDTVFAKRYTDTTNSYETGEKATTLPDSSFIICGQRAYKTGNYPYTGLLYKTDKNGNKLWRKTLSAGVSDLGTFLQSVQYLSGDTILLGGYARDYQESTVEFINRPYFALMDTGGIVLYNKFYSSGYRGGGSIYKDKNGGYFHWGRKDSLVTANPLNFENHPGYLAHLDDSFNFVWTYVYYDTIQAPYKMNVQNVKQLLDSGYLVMGTWQQIDDIPSVEAYVGKLDKNGNLLWQHRFHVDTGTYNCYLVDAVEKPDKSLLLVGSAKNAFNPVPWNQDFWLVGLDSNGCITAGCSPTGVVQLPQKTEEVKVYPNPTNGTLTVSVPEKGKISVMNLQGQTVGVYKLAQGTNKIMLASFLPAGLYLGHVELANGKKEMVRLSLIR